MKNIFDSICGALPVFKELRTAVVKNYTPCGVTGVSNIHKSHLLAGLSGVGRVCVICDDESAAHRLVSDINALAGEESACVFPARDFNFSHLEGVSREYEQARITALTKLETRRASIVVASVEAALQSTIPPQALRKETFSLKAGAQIELKLLVERLLENGYTRTEQIEGPAQFAVRGAIADVFPIASGAPVRVELWGDEIDSISYFDIETQRRTDTAEEIAVPPAAEILLPAREELLGRLSSLAAKARGKNAEKIRAVLAREAELVRAGITLTNTDKFYSVAYETPATLLDYFDSGIAVFSEYTNCAERAKGFFGQLSEDLKILYEEGILFKELDGFYTELPALTARAEQLRAVYLDTFMRGYGDVKFKKLINANCYQTASWGGNLPHLVDELKTFTEQNYCTVVFAGSERTLPIIVNDLRESGINAAVLSAESPIERGVVYVATGSVSGGFEYPDIKCALITQIKTLKSKKRAPQKKHIGEGLKNLSDISAGDLVVHSLYGIGKFTGISKIETNNVTKDYITIKYAGTDVLYVPVTQLDLVSRYVGAQDDSAVRLNKLNSQEWAKTRTRVKTAVRDMAEELTKLYAKRQLAMGFAFSPDNDWQNDFEQRFDYQETDDQLRSIAEIKADMQKAVPMDRLLCGDVGFGKTEVALRAAFKCMLDSKQCAILVPTTVLAWQHYQTAIKRFEHFPIKVELLSRFRSPKEQQQILRKVKTGEVDLIIGTHRLVQKDVKFRDLGLVVIDEEQRFGVAHKEKFKESFSGVDVLTLSATPIPRTLNMAMSGIRDMSVIEEPPQDRYPVQTYVIEQNNGIIAQAISKEIRRGGQVYYIHNRIETIDRCVTRLQGLVPEARIGVAHGQISETALSEIWRQLIDREIDVLVCTTLIETGVDVPNVNTLIIEDADRLGLSQLYQLRGRVGRSNRRAFAYFTFRRGKVLTEIAAKRLNAIKEFTQFGSGFRIAMRDLEIRGAGSVLSGKQHGHLEAVGYDMYLRLLSEAIAEQKGEALPRSPEDCLVDVSIDAYIPDKYIRSLTQRIDCYRRIASIQDKEDSADVIDELIDRYGEPPKSVMGLINVALMRNTASSLGITEISQRNDSLFFFIKQPQVAQILSLSKKYKGRISFSDSTRPYISVALDKPAKQKAPDLMAEVLAAMKEATV
ncbi:MAG: transcription-repair coupling factor [Oscillospiraceae bacterium]